MNRKPLVAFALAVGLAMTLFAPHPSHADTGATKPRTVIACFHEHISRFTAEAHPSRCDIWGYRGKQFAGALGAEITVLAPVPFRWHFAGIWS